MFSTVFLFWSSDVGRWLKVTQTLNRLEISKPLFVISMRCFSCLPVTFQSFDQPSFMSLFWHSAMKILADLPCSRIGSRSVLLCRRPRLLYVTVACGVLLPEVCPLFARFLFIAACLGKPALQKTRSIMLPHECDEMCYRPASWRRLKRFINPEHNWWRKYECQIGPGCCKFDETVRTQTFTLFVPPLLQSTSISCRWLGETHLISEQNSMS